MSFNLYTNEWAKVDIRWYPVDGSRLHTRWIPRSFLCGLRLKISDNVSIYILYALWWCMTAAWLLTLLMYISTLCWWMDFLMHVCVRVCVCVCVFVCVCVCVTPQNKAGSLIYTTSWSLCRRKSVCQTEMAPLRSPAVMPAKTHIQTHTQPNRPQRDKSYFAEVIFQKLCCKSYFAKVVDRSCLWSKVLMISCLTNIWSRHKNTTSCDIG